MFLSCIPLPLTARYLDLFFVFGWDFYYEVVLHCFGSFEQQALELTDSADILYLIKDSNEHFETVIELASLACTSRSTFLESSGLTDMESSTKDA